MAPTPNLSSINRSFFVHSVRLEEIVHIDAMMCDDIFFDPIRTRLQSEFTDVQQALLEGGLPLRRIRRAESFDEMESSLARMTWKFPVGFLIKARQPYFIIDGENTFGYSWELSRARWFFARTYDLALERICAWASLNQNEARARLVDGRADRV
jgi:hypothetical protein